MSGRLARRVAAVTDAAHGTGRAGASRLAAEGASVAGPDLADGSGTVAQVEAAGCKGVALVADAADPDQVTAAAREVEAALGVPDILVNNGAAGAGSST